MLPHPSCCSRVLVCEGAVGVRAQADPRVAVCSWIGSVFPKQHQIGRRPSSVSSSPLQAVSQCGLLPVRGGGMIHSGTAFPIDEYVLNVQ